MSPLPQCIHSKGREDHNGRDSAAEDAENAEELGLGLLVL